MKILDTFQLYLTILVYYVSFLAPQGILASNSWFNLISQSQRNQPWNWRCSHPRVHFNLNLTLSSASGKWWTSSSCSNTNTHRYMQKHTHTHKTSGQFLFIQPSKYLLSAHYVPETMSGILITRSTWFFLSKSPGISRTKSQANGKLQHSELLDPGMYYRNCDMKYIPQIFKILVHKQSMGTKTGLNKLIRLYLPWSFEL